MMLREGNNETIIGMNFLRQAFKMGDVDGSGSLTYLELSDAFSTDAVQQKLEKLQLTVPDWEGIFDAIDADGDGELTWEEMSRGIEAIWDKN